MKFFLSKTLEISTHNGFHLIPDNIGTRYPQPWNDYNFVITFNLHYVKQSTIIKLGLMKLLVKDQNETSAFFIQNSPKVKDSSIYDITDSLESVEIVSIGLDLDFYRKLHALLDRDEVEAYLERTGDAGFFYSNYDYYSQWPGFSAAILRDRAEAKLAIRKGSSIATGDYALSTEINFEISQLPETIEQVSFRFKNTSSLNNERINLLIGKNGLGKTHILKKITECISGIIPDAAIPIYFHKLIIVAYSPFEALYTENELYTIVDKMTGGNSRKKGSRKLRVNKYSYIGFRDESDSFNLHWPKQHAARSLIEIIRYDKENNLWSSKSRFKILYETLKLSMDFDHIGIISQNGEIIKISNENYEDINTGQKFDYTRGLSFYKNNQLIPLSSGQIIYSYMLPTIVSGLEEESLILLDEPELYLHPALEIGLVSMLKKLLEETSSYAIIATHSAVIAREVPKSCVTVLRQESSNLSSIFTTTSRPNIETYGASLESIIGEVFDDHYTAKPYESEIDKIVRTCKSPSEAVSAIGEKIGDEALVYLLSKIDQTT